MGQSLLAVATKSPLATVEPADARALQELYLRRNAVIDLIRSLEEYQSSLPKRASCVPITAAG